MKYIQDTLNPRPSDNIISVIRKRGTWVLDCDDETAIEDFGYNGWLPIPSPEYLEWLEEIALKTLL